MKNAIGADAQGPTPPLPDNSSPAPRIEPSMRNILRNLAVTTLALSLTSGVAFAQEHHDDQARHDQEHHDQEHHDQYVRHDDWRRGRHMRHEDWDRGQRIDDWQARHLRRPPRGYEWRDIDGQYVLANPDGVIFQVVVPR